MSQIQVTGEAKIRDLQGPVVANSGVITALDGAANQYVRGDGALASFPTVTGGGSSVSLYLNGSVNQGTFGGSTYYELGENAITGVGTNFSKSTDGLIAQFITDANVPDQTEIPSGNWNVEFFMGVSASSGALASFYVEIYKYDGTTFTLVGTNVTTPEFLTNTTTIDAYFTSVAMPLTTLNQTDRIAVRVFVSVAGKTVTLYTEDNRLCQVVTTFSRGMLSLNSLTDQQQYLTVGTAGTDFNIVSSVDTHTFNIPSASATNRGLITTGSQTIAGVKTFLNSTIQEGLSVLKNDAFQVIPSGYTALTGYGLGGLTILQGDGTNVYNTDLDFPNTSNRQYTFPDITGTVALLQGTQTFTGSKTFTANTFFNKNTSLLKDPTGILPDMGYITSYVTSWANGFVLNLLDGTSTFKSSLKFDNSTDFDYTFPNLSGTLALTSDLSLYVPYSGATANVDLNSYNIFSNNVYADGDGASTNGGILIKQYSGAFTANSGYTSLFATPNQLGINFGGIYSAFLQSASLTASRTYTFPNASGTVALTSNLSAYVPYTGATANVDLGSNSLNTNGFITGSVIIAAPSSGSSSGVLYLKQGNTSVTSEGSVTLISDASYRLRIGEMVSSVPKSIAFDFSGVSASTLRTFSLPDASGTLALTSNLSAYLPLTGGTLTGNLTIAKSDTLNVLTLSSTNSNVISFITSSVQKGEISVNASNFQFNSFTTNGYIFKNSAANNVLSITDAGVTTLIGALNGTSATFSSSVTANNLFVINTGQTFQVKPSSANENYKSGLYTSSTDNEFYMYNGSGSQTVKILASTGAATFSSSVTAGGVTTINTGAIGAGLSLDVNNTGTYGLIGVRRGTQTNASAGISYYTTTSFKWFSGIFENTDDFGFYSTGTNGFPLVIKHSSGNVGIGTSSPSEILTVNGNIALIGANTTIKTSVNSSLAMQLNNATANDFQLNGAGPFRVINQAYNAVLMQVNNNGNVGIGTSSPVRTLTVNGQFASVGGQAAIYTAARDSTSDYAIYASNSTTLFLFNSGIGNIGSFTTATGVYTPLSDINKKKDFEESTIGLKEVLQLKPTLYRMKSEDESASKELGFIAQEVKEFIPQAYVESGEEDDKFIGLNFNAITAGNTKAIQELYELVINQQSQIEELSNKIVALQSK